MSKFKQENNKSSHTQNVDAAYTAGSSNQDVTLSSRWTIWSSIRKSRKKKNHKGSDPEIYSGFKILQMFK